MPPGISRLVPARTVRDLLAELAKRGHTRTGKPGQAACGHLQDEEASLMVESDIADHGETGAVQR
jgi:hypothetical protein